MSACMWFHISQDSISVLAGLPLSLQRRPSEGIPMCGVQVGAGRVHVFVASDASAEANPDQALRPRPPPPAAIS